MNDIIRLSAATMAEAIKEGELSAVEVANAHYDRIDAVDDRVHAFLELTRDAAMATANAVDAKRSAGEALGPLAGVPLGLKDVLTMRGEVTTAGSKSCRGGGRRTTPVSSSVCTTLTSSWRVAVRGPPSSAWLRS